MVDLGEINGEASEGWAINDAGQIAGSSIGHIAFITGPNGMGMTDLNSLVSLPSGIVLTEATAINNMGQVVVNGYSIPAVPEPTSYVLMIAGLGLVGFMARRRKAGEQSRRAQPCLTI
jgi:uncharacterized membrane protein